MTYEPPSDPEERLIEIALDSWVNYARWILWFCGIVYIMLGLGLGPISTAGMITDPDMPRGMAIAIFVGSSLFSLVICGSIGVVNLVTSSGLGRGSKWAWYVALVLGALYLPSGCCLFGAVLLYAMINEKTRRLFLG
jgi:hypothetical protein